jgi:hypothetical protein
MIAVRAHLADTLENFNAEQQWKREHDVWLNDFFNETDQRIIFFWNDFDDPSVLKVNTASAPKFYGKYLHHSEFKFELLITILFFRQQYQSS